MRIKKKNEEAIMELSSMIVRLKSQIRNAKDDIFMRSCYVHGDALKEMEKRLEALQIAQRAILIADSEGKL